jgi:hypothetical protein
MDYDQIFRAYYTLYRAESEIPASSDDEYVIGIPLANEAINHWKTYEGTYWKELFNFLSTADDGDTTITTGDTEYDAPSDMAEYGGFIKAKDSNGKTVQKWPLIEPNEVHFKGDDATFAYFTGDPTNGFVLHLNPAPSAALNGKTLEYPYYKQPTEFTTGTDVTEMSNAYFIVHRMLANRFRASRNPYYEDALRDAENALMKMKMDNDSGSWANPFKLPDHSGSVWGEGWGI